MLVAGEVAIGTVLLVGSDSCWRASTVWSMRHADLMAVTSSVAGVLPPSSRYQAVERQVSFVKTVQEAVAPMPGVKDVAVSSRVSTHA